MRHQAGVRRRRVNDQRRERHLTLCARAVGGGQAHLLRGRGHGHLAVPFAEPVEEPLQSLGGDVHPPAAPCGRPRSGSHCSSSPSRSSSTRCPATSRRRARSRSHHSTRSTSGNSASFPDRGGHCMLNIPGTTVAGSRSLSAAHTDRRLPDGCFASPRGTRESSPTGNGTPSSSSHSRTAASRGCSGSTYSPFGTDQAPSSFPVQNGPPMCAISTCTPTSVLRHSRIPALRTGTAYSLSCAGSPPPSSCSRTPMYDD